MFAPPLSETAPRLWVCLSLLVVSACSETQPHVKNLTHEAPTVRLVAAAALEQLGPDARRATPHLIDALNDSPYEVRKAIVAALASIGAPAVPDLIEALVNLAPGATRATVLASVAVSEALASIGPPAVPDLIELLQNRDEQVRTSAIGALRRVGPDAEAAVPHLIDILANDDESGGMHMQVADALGSFGPSGKAAVPSLIRALNERPLSDGPAGPAIRDYAAQSLGRLGPDATAAIPKLRTLLEDPSQRVRVSAAVALAFIGPDAGYSLAESPDSGRVAEILEEELLSATRLEQERIQRALDIVNGAKPWR